MSEVKLAVAYEDYENGVTIKQLIEELAAKPESKELESLIIGDWGGSYENDSSTVVETLIQSKDAFPQLRKLFIGDMDSEECEVSWIMQSDLSPLFTAFPGLTSLTIQGSTDLSLEPARHEKLEELVIICGGLGKSVLDSIAQAHFPRLKKLELYLGVDNYGFDGTLEDVLQVAKPRLFPELTYLGLKDSEIQDEIAAALADAPILDQLHTLDLSMGTLTDAGAEVLLNSERVKKLRHLDLSHHFMSEKMIKLWEQSGLSVDISDAQDEDDEYRYPALTE